MKCTFPELVAEELAQARRDYSPMVNAHEAYAVILEECQEFWDEVKIKQGNRNPPQMRLELVQIAAMCQRAAEDLGLTRPEA